MNNLAKAREKLGEKTAEEKQIENLINPPPVMKKIKVPPARDVNLIESILNKRLDEKTKIYKEKIENEVKERYKNKFDGIHQKAMDLKDEAIIIAKEIIDENNGKLKLRFMDENSYNSGYLKDLPDTMEEAREDVGLEVNDDDYPIIDELRKEVDEFVLNVKLGLEPLAGVKPLLEKIDKELKI